MKLRSETL